MLNIKTESSKVIKGDRFIDLESSHDNVVEAINKGAKIIITSKSINNYPCILVKNANEYLKNVLKEISPIFKDMHLIGIINSNNTTDYLSKLLSLNAYNVSVIKDGLYTFSDKVISKDKMNLLNLYNNLIDSKKRKVDYCLINLNSVDIDKELLEGLKLDMVLINDVNYNDVESINKINNYIKYTGCLIINNDNYCSNKFKKNNYKTIAINTYGDFKLKVLDKKDNYLRVNINHENINYVSYLNMNVVDDLYSYLMAYSSASLIGVNEYVISQCSKYLECKKLTLHP